MSGDEYRWHYDYARLAWDSGFSFQNYRLKNCIDKNLGLIDIDQIIKERDIATIEKHINTVSEFSLDNDQTSVLDPSFVKIFRLSQLSVQYLLFCKKYLDNTVVLIKQEFIKNNEEIKQLKKYTDDLKQEIMNYKKQVKDLKSALNCQIANTQNVAVFQCNECPKAFSTEEYLSAHIKRRHESLGNLPNTAFQAETDKLQLEIKELKERLNNTEKFIHNDDPSRPIADLSTIGIYNRPIENPFLLELQQKFEFLKIHVENELQILQTQKFDQEKYEKWFETFLHKLDNSHKQAKSTINEEFLFNNSSSSRTVLKDSSNQTDIVNKSVQYEHSNHFKKCESTDKVESAISYSTKTDNNTTQTDVMTVEYGLCRNCQAMHSNATDQTEKIENEQSVNEIHGQNSQQRLHVRADNHLEKFEEMLQEKVTGSIEKLENRIETFWNKINEIERKKLQVDNLPENNDTFIKSVDIDHHIVIPKPRKRIFHTKDVKPNSLKNNPQENHLEHVKQIILPKNSKITKVKVNSYKDSDVDSTSEESELSNSSEDERKVIHEPVRVMSKVLVAKPSTTSTLGQRSLTSLKEAAFKPEVQKELRKEVERLLNNNLEELGVFPGWTTLPMLSFHRAIKTATHKASLAQKSIPNYKTIRSTILRDVDKKVLDKTKSISSSRTSKLKVFIDNVKSKAKFVAKIQTEASDRQNILKPKTYSSAQQKLPEKYSLDKRDTVQKNVICESDTENESNLNKEIVEIVHKNITDPIKNTYSNVIQELSASVNYLKTREADSSELVDNVSTEKESKMITIKDDVENDVHSDTKVEAQAKGVLKNYPSSGSLHKKRVIFDLEPSHNLNENQEKSAIKTNDTGSTTSNASSILDGPQANILERVNKKTQELSDVSDWDLSEMLD